MSGGDGFGVSRGMESRRKKCVVLSKWERSAKPRRREPVYSCKVGKVSMRSSRNRHGVKSGRPWLLHATTLICLVLLTLLAFVQVAHVHPAATDADHCPICVVMHSAAPVAAVAAAVLILRGSAPIPVPVVHSVVRRWHCTMFNRPPPMQAHTRA